MHCALLSLLIACGTEGGEDEGSASWKRASWPTVLDDGLVVSWDLQASWGRETYYLTREGDSAMRLRANGTNTAIDRAVPEREMEQLRNRLRIAGCCELGGPYRDMEEQGTLRIRLPELSCDVTLPLVLWDIDPIARGCDEALRRMWSRRRPAPPLAPGRDHPESASESDDERDDQ